MSFLFALLSGLVSVKGKDRRTKFWKLCHRHGIWEKELQII